MKRFLTLPLMLLTFILLSACSPANEQIPATDMSDQQGNHEGDEENIPDIPTTGNNGPYLILFVLAQVTRNVWHNKYNLNSIATYWKCNPYDLTKKITMPC